MALADGLIHDGVSVFDYGCGRGDDLRYLKLRGILSKGWDPVHQREEEIASAQVVNLGYVVNVIEDPDERSHCLERAWSLAERALIVSARLTSETAELASVARVRGRLRHLDPDLPEVLRAVRAQGLDRGQPLSEPAVAAAPGVFYVFRDAEDRMAFLASRYRRHRHSFLPSVESTLDDHKELLRPLVEFFEERGRAPAARMSSRAGMRSGSGSGACNARYDSFERALRC